MASNLLSDDLIDDLVGVIDLKDGAAVHAVAGARSEYQPVQRTAGDAVALADLYWSLGLKRLYVADLNGITRGQLQSELLDDLVVARPWNEFLVDCGSTEDSLSWPEGQTSDACAMIVATEAAESVDRLQECADRVGHERMALGLDYRKGHFVSSQGDEQSWIQAARSIGISRAVVLDVSSVGTRNCSAAIDCCRRIQSLGPTLDIYSGGGIQDRNDVAALRAAGCHRFLVATAILDG